MGRNYFSRHGGPYFINEGVSKHHDHHTPGHIHEDIKPSNLIYGLLGILAIVLPLSMAIVILAIL